MLLEFISRYYKFLWLLLGVVAFLKIMLSYYFHGGLEGLNGVIYALFKWYGEDEQEIEDFGPRRTTMRLHNIVTLFIYIILALIVIATLLSVVIGR